MNSDIDRQEKKIKQNTNKLLNKKQIQMFKDVKKKNYTKVK